MNRMRLMVIVGVFLVVLSSGAAYFGAQMVISNDDGDLGNQVISSPDSSGSTSPTTPNVRQTPSAPDSSASSDVQADLSSSEEESKPEDGSTRLLTDETDKAQDLGAARDADEIPSIIGTPPDAAGTFVKMEDNSLFIGTGQVDIAVNSDHAAGGALAPSITTTYNGPMIEIVITHDTAIISQKLSGRPTGYGTAAFNNDSLVMAVGSLDKIGKNTFVRVWGQRRGDRIVAEALAYLNPGIME